MMQWVLSRAIAKNVHRVQSLAEFLTRGPQKLVFVNDISVTERLFVELVARFGNRLQVVRSFDRYVEITNREASKGKAVEWLAQRWGIARDEVIALGDQDNDRSMIEWAGLGVAMGNAVEGVKAMADYIAPTASDDGVAEVIEKFVLEN
jgi:Cof subfamily protein (haloacid dehalogenase superfamily)